MTPMFLLRLSGEWVKHGQPRRGDPNGPNILGMRKLIYPLVNGLHNYRKSPFIMGKLTIHGPCSIVMLNYQRVKMLLNVVLV